MLGLTVLRLLWRLFAGAPAPVAGTPRWQAAIASATHGVLYLILLAMPLSGWLFHSASGFPPRNLSWFGLFKLPVFFAKNPALAETLKPVHYWLNMAMAAVVAPPPPPRATAPDASPPPSPGGGSQFRDDTGP